MNWEKLKTFLIVLFSAINVFLIVTMIATNRSANTIPKQTIQDTVKILKANNINIDENIIDDEVKNMGEITVKPITKSDDYSKNISKSDGVEFEMVFDRAVLNDKDMKSLLSKGGFDEYEISKSFSDGYGIAQQCIKGYRIFDSRLEVKSQGQKSTISGIWFDPQSLPKKSDNNTNIVILPSILINLISNVNRPQTEITISSIDYGYCIAYSGADAVLYTATPCWRFVTDGGMEFYYDARTGEYIK